MMASIMSYFGRRDTKQSAREAIVGLRQQLQMIEKKEDHLQKKIDQELKIAKANAVSNKPRKLRWMVRMLAFDPSSSGDLCVEAEARERDPTGTTAGTADATRNASQHPGISQSERGNDGRNEEGCRCPAANSFWHVRGLRRCYEAYLTPAASPGRSPRSMRQWRL